MRMGQFTEIVMANGLLLQDGSITANGTIIIAWFTHA
jgi:hypothetical protein